MKCVTKSTGFFFYQKQIAFIDKKILNNTSNTSKNKLSGPEVYWPLKTKIQHVTEISNRRTKHKQKPTQLS